jgi:hypothetical protein
MTSEEQQMTLEQMLDVNVADTDTSMSTETMLNEYDDSLFPLSADQMANINLTDVDTSTVDKENTLDQQVERSVDLKNMTIDGILDSNIIGNADEFADEELRVPFVFTSCGVYSLDDLLDIAIDNTGSQN